MPQDQLDIGALITRNVILGIVIAFVVTVLIALPAGGLATAVGVAFVPALFAGPFVGGLITMVALQRRSPDPDD